MTKRVEMTEQCAFNVLYALHEKFRIEEGRQRANEIEGLHGNAGALQRQAARTAAVIAEFLMQTELRFEFLKLVLAVDK